MKKKSLWRNLLVILLGVILLIVLIIYNIKNNSNFFDTPLYTILNLLVAIVVAFYLTQLKNNQRKLKETVESIVNKIQNDLLDDRARIITKKDDIKWLMMMHRQVSNRINILKNISQEVNIEKYVNFIDEKFIEYREFTGNHINDIEFLSKSGKDLERIVLLIDVKLDEIKIELYRNF